MALGIAAQEDFSAGAVRAVARHLIPEDGTYDVENGLHDETGAIYRRGGCTYQTTSAFGASLRFIFDGYFPAGQRTLVASPADFGVVDSVGTSVTDLGGAGLNAPVPTAMLGGVLYIGGGVLYGGSRETADYSTGTVTATNGSTAVTGAGTVWTTNVDAGMLIRFSGAGRYYRVASVTSDTVLVLAETFEGTTGAGKTYAATRLGDAASAGTRAASLYTVCADKLVTLEGNRLYVSNGVNPTTGNFQPHVFDSTDWHELPDGAEGVAVTTVGDRVLAFTTAGLFVLSGVGLDIVDFAGNPQRRVQLLSSELIGWGSTGLAMWGQSVVVATTAGVWLVDGVSSPRLLSRTIAPVLQAYVRAGYLPGQAAVYRGHLFLPIYNGSYAMVDMLVCRLEEDGAWSRFSGQAAEAMAVAARAPGGVSPELYAASRGADARVLKLGSVFEPAAAVKSDADGTTHEFLVETRDYRTGAARNENLVRRVVVRYQLEDGGTDNPVLSLYYSTGEPASGDAEWDAVLWGSFSWATEDAQEYTQAAGGAPEDDGRRPFAWEVNAHTEFIRYRLVCVDPCKSLTVRAVASHIRQSGKTF